MTEWSQMTWRQQEQARRKYDQAGNKIATILMKLWGVSDERGDHELLAADIADLLRKVSTMARGEGL